MGVNTKADAARARKSAVDTERKEKETREKEDQYWREAEGSKSRAAKKKEEEAEKRAEAAARKAEARRLAEQEEKELEKSMKKVDKKATRVSIPVPKVTEVELRRRREEEQAEAERKAEEAKKQQSRTAAEEEYERMVLISNTNRDDSIIEARTLDDAIAQMTVVDNLPPDRHPERRLKASFKVILTFEMDPVHYLLTLTLMLSRRLKKLSCPSWRKRNRVLLTLSTRTWYGSYGRNLLTILLIKSVTLSLSLSLHIKKWHFSHKLLTIWADCWVNGQLQLNAMQQLILGVVAFLIGKCYNTYLDYRNSYHSLHFLSLYEFHFLYMHINFE